MDEPRIGIYWVHHHRVIGVHCALADGEQGVPDLIDSPYGHFDWWDRHVADTCPTLVGLNYDDIPRGRVLYDCRHGKPVIYGDRSVVGGGRTARSRLRGPNSCRDLVADFFGFRPTEAVWLPDALYAVGRLRAG